LVLSLSSDLLLAETLTAVIFVSHAHRSSSRRRRPTLSAPPSLEGREGGRRRRRRRPTLSAPPLPEGREELAVVGGAWERARARGRPVEDASTTQRGKPVGRSPRI